MDRPFLIQGHRGARGLRPENTLPSFGAALDGGANSVETDVHLSADGVPMLIHDPELPNGTPVRARTAKQLAVAGIQTLAALYAFIESKTWNNQPIIVDVEIKCVPFRGGSEIANAERAVLEVIRSAKAIEWTWVRSFDHRCVRRLREMEPGLAGVAIIEGTTPVDPVALVRAAEATVYAPDYLFLDEEQIRRCQDAGIRVLPWTVNDPTDWERLIAWGVDGITTDYPDRLAAFVGRET